MKKQILSLFLMMAMLIGLLPMSVFTVASASSGLAASGLHGNYLDPNSVSKSETVEPAIVVGYNTNEGTEAIKINGELGQHEGWVLSGRLMNAASVLKGSFCPSGYIPNLPHILIQCVSQTYPSFPNTSPRIRLEFFLFTFITIPTILLNL